MATQDEKIKWVEGTPFMVDGFRFTNPKCKHYLLTHFHSDHTTGLYKSFSAGTIYTSKGTADLIVELMGVNRERVVALPMDTPVFVEGFELTLIDANHCPAAVMFVIRDPRPGGRISLHTGDFRAAKIVCTNPIVKSLKGRLDSLYLDTTYCGPRHTFPDQQEVLAQAGKLVRMELQRDPKTLFVVGTYSIGKEKVLEAVARAADTRCLVTSRKARTMRLSGAWDDSCYTTHDASTGGGVLVDGDSGAPWYARVRAAPLQDTNSPATLLGVLAEARAGGAPFTSVVGVRPTGWTHTNARKGTGGGDKAWGVQSSIAGRPRSNASAAAAAAAGVASEASGGGKPRGVGVGLASGRGRSEGDEGESECQPGGEDQDDEAAAWGAGGGCEDDGDEWTAAAATATNGVDAAAVPPSMSSSSSSSSSSSYKTAPAGEAWSGKKPWVDGNARVYSLPYSEHSSFNQLKDFVRAVKPKKIVPTVNAASSASVEKMLSHFLELMDLSSDRKRLDSYFCKRGPPATPTACGSRGSSTPVPCARGPQALNKPAQKRRRDATGGDAGSTLLPGAEKFPNPRSEARERSFRDNGGAIGTPHRRQSLSALAPHDSGSAARGKGNASRLSGGRVGNPYAAAVAVHRPPVASPDAAAGSRSAATLEPAVAAPAAPSGGAIELDRVDVEAQRAIMADIERRKREQQEGQGRAGGGASPGKTTGGARLGCSGKGRSAEQRRKAGGSGQKPRGPFSVRNGGSCSEGGGTAGASLRGVFGGRGVSCAARAGRAAQQPAADFDGDPQVLSVDDESDESTANSPMDIRDFFSR